MKALIGYTLYGAAIERGKNLCRLISNSEEETQKYGAELAVTLKEGDIVAIFGELGSGKTAFTKGIAKGLGITEEVTSPTYTLLKEYNGRMKLYHFDLYRIDGEEELQETAFYDYAGGDGVCVIEWPEKAPIPAHVSVRIEGTGNDTRKISVERPKNDDDIGC